MISDAHLSIVTKVTIIISIRAVREEGYTFILLIIPEIFLDPPINTLPSVDL